MTKRAETKIEGSNDGTYTCTFTSRKIKKIFERKCIKIKNEMKRQEKSSTIGIYLDDIKVIIAINNSNKENEEVWDNVDLIIN